jgi:hypothetical protein
MKKGRFQMTNLKMLKILNPIMAITFLVTIKAVFLYKYSPFFNLKGSETVYEIHEIAGKLLFLMIILHIILNWNWIKSQIFGIKAKPKAPASKKSK